jgi:hypothetical protein
MAARPVVHLEEHLGGQHHVFAAAEGVDRPADDLFGTAERVDVRRVPERNSQVDRLSEVRLRFVF